MSNEERDRPDPENHGATRRTGFISLPLAKRLLTRRSLLGAVGGLATVAVVGRYWQRLNQDASYQGLLDLGDVAGQRLQRLAMWNRPLAPEYRTDQISANHPVNGGFGASYIDADPEYDRMAARGFRDWRLRIAGLVAHPQTFGLSEIQSMPSRTQITMHCCDAGWSAIGEWTGVPLGWLLQHVGITPQARYIVFHAMDKIAGQHLFDSIDLFDAFHPQTILAHRFNGASLNIGHGAPLRLRVELQIGYKNLKHLHLIEAVDSLRNVAGGRGGYFQTSGYQWYAGE